MLRVLSGVRSASRGLFGPQRAPGRVFRPSKFRSTRSAVHLRFASTITTADKLLRQGDFNPSNLGSLSPREAFTHTPVFYPEEVKSFYDSIEFQGLEEELLERIRNEPDVSKRLGKLMAFLRNQIVQGHAVQETHLLEWFKKYVRIEDGQIKPLYARETGELQESDVRELLNHVVNRTQKPSVEFLKWLAQDDSLLCEHHLFRSYIKDLLISRGFSVERQGKIDLRHPEELYPDARMITRRIICHLGPTNSGKTYRALERLKKAKSGYYAGPLRLLARETYDRIKDEGLPINLKTGEEVINCEDEFGRPAPLTAGTVEMIDTNQLMEVCVIDEIQMLADQSRGWAWLNALLGVQAKEVHLCGEESVIHMIEKIVAKTGDTLEINRYERLGTLEVERRPMRSLSEVRAGDCVVAFSRKKVFQYRQEIEERTGKKCSIIYGALPPETRVTQSRDFNTGVNEVLVATDAVGMGLNLSINRIIFAAVRKYDGTGDFNLLEPPQTKQIAGRAGRYKVPGSDKVGSVGLVTAFTGQQKTFVEECLATPTMMLETLYVKPHDDLFAPLVSGVKGLAKLMARMNQLTEISKGYRLPSFESQLELSQACFQGLSLDQALNISGLPFGSAEYCESQVLAMTRAMALGTVYTTAQLSVPALKAFLTAPVSIERLKIMEDLHKMISAYRWLQNRYPQTFVDIEGVTKLRLQVEGVINDILRSTSRDKKKR
ncbi:ATP-dependent RNA helicase SUV3 [Yarrowia sp. B02]|nr:ATP-dependent RNA helicase SUV3 [Yarrowia sp. B02]